MDRSYYPIASEGSLAISTQSQGRRRSVSRGAGFPEALTLLRSGWARNAPVRLWSATCKFKLQSPFQPLT